MLHRPIVTALPLRLALISVLVFVSACSDDIGVVSPAPDSEEDPPEIQLGERLFLETRFAQFFAAHSGGRVNQPLAQGDPVVETTETTGEPLPGPFAGTSINCRSCHLVDELQDDGGNDVRTYSDLARHSPIPARDGSGGTTPRNSPTLVGSTVARDVPVLLHFDGEFASTEDLVRGTLTGRNFGWLPTETVLAVANLGDVIRHDDGSGDLAADFGALSYRTVLGGTAPSIPDSLRIPPEYRIDVDQATDSQTLDAVAKLIAAYVESLSFVADDSGLHSGSPYDLFLEKNDLPRVPADGESPLAYSQRLLSRVAQLSQPVFVTSADGAFQFHHQIFQFGPTELEGLKIFFAQPSAAGETHRGNCIACHAAPEFTDFQLHNTGVTQLDYDTIHGTGSFASLPIPDLAERSANVDLYLPPSASHPTASGRYRSVTTLVQPGYTDLGVWNVFANADIPTPQTALTEILCAQFGATVESCTPNALLPRTVGLFKTPSLRDLGQSDPYFHSGAMSTVEECVSLYLTISELARQAQVLNAAPELSSIFIDTGDITPLSRFLAALNEDYN